MPKPSKKGSTRSPSPREKKRPEDWGEEDIKHHYRDNYRYDNVEQYTRGNRFEKLWFRQRISIISRVMRKMQFSTNGKKEEGGYWIIDVGSGTGAISAELAKRFIVTNTLAMDISPWCIRKARGYHASLSRMHYAIGDAFTLPIKHETASVVLLTEVLEHVKDMTPIVREARRILKDGGLLVISVPNKYHPLWRISTLRKVFSSGYGKKEGREEPFHRYFSYGEIKDRVVPLGFEPISHRTAGLGITQMAFFRAVKG